MSQRKGLLNALSRPGRLRASLYPRSLHADRVENVAEGNLRKAAYTGAPEAASSGSKGDDCGQRLEDRQHERPPAAVAPSMGPTLVT